ncbi:MAG: hypothetical protein HQM10_20230 [Candidatus Riflebacteria bacterium]|nr:hypothetical protein [Candidatus Riflebacteria bacterium]
MNFRFFVVLCCVACLFCMNGCGSGGGSNLGDDPSPNVGTIAGTVFDPTNSASVLAATVSGKTIEGAYVYLEENPEVFTWSGSNGGYSLSGVPAGKTLHVVSRYRSSNYYYRFRSDAVVVSPSESKEVLSSVSKADKKVRVVLLDNQGNTLYNAKIKVWGETFYTDASGSVLLEMPSGNVEVAMYETNYASQTIWMNFREALPAMYEYSLMPTSDSNKAPTITITADYLAVAKGGQVNLTANGYDPDGDSLTYSWWRTAGEMATNTNSMTNVWYAPNFDTIATLSGRVSDGRGGRSTAALQVKVGTGGNETNSAPVITTISGSSTVLVNGYVHLQAEASDPDGTPSKYVWTCSVGSFPSVDLNYTSSSATWQAPSQAGTATVTLTAYDGRDYNLYTSYTKTISVLSSINHDPVISIVASGTRIPVNTMINLVASWTDIDGDTVSSFSWIASGGTLSASSGATVSWTAPAVVSSATLSVYGTDGKGGSMTANLELAVISSTNGTPTLSITPNYSIAPLSLSFNLSAIASDPDAEALTYSWTSESGVYIPSPNASVTACVGTSGSRTVTITCVVTDTRGGSATATAKVKLLSTDANDIASGVHFSIEVATPTYVHIPTTGGSEKYGLILYSKNTADASYTLEVNGGGASLRPLSLESASSYRMRPFTPKFVALEQQIRQMRAEILRKRSFMRPLGSTPMMRNINDEKLFYVPSDDTSGVSTITARLLATGTKCEIFVDYAIATISDTVTAIEGLRNVFDASIYNFVMTNYASESEYLSFGDLNSDSKITILISPAINNIGAVGVFHPKDYTSNWYSNQEDMFYLADASGTSVASYQDEALLTVVHEFQHLVNFVAHTKVISGGQDEEAWLNEGLSVGAEVRYSGKPSGFFNSYAGKPYDDGLTVWSDSLSDYGSTGLFVHYLYEQLGTETVRSLVRSDAVGISNVDLNAPANRKFWQLFEDWGVAMFRAGKGFAAKADYDYKLDPAITLGKSSKTYSGTFNASMRGNSFRFVELQTVNASTTRLLLNDSAGTGQFGAVFIRMQ